MIIGEYEIKKKPINRFSKYATYNQLLIKRKGRVLKVMNYRKGKFKEKELEAEKYVKHLLALAQ